MPDMLLAYVGPETVVPVASLLAAAGGIVLGGWRWIKMACVACFRRQQAAGGASSAGPHDSTPDPS